MQNCPQGKLLITEETPRWKQKAYGFGIQDLDPYNIWVVEVIIQTILTHELTID